MRTIYLLSALILFSFGFRTASGETPANRVKEEKEKAVAKKDSVTAYDKLFKEKHQTAKGMILLHKIKEKLYFEIPLEMMGREMLIASTVTETSDNANGIVGGKADPIHVLFSKTGESIQLRRVNTDFITDNPNSNIARAIERSTIGSVMRNMKIEAYSNDSTSVVVDMTGFFAGDNKDLTPFDKYSQYTMFNGLRRTESFQQDKSFLGEIKAFSDNVVVSSTLSYTYTLTDVRTNRTIVKDEPFTAVVTRSVVLLSEKPARPRYADYRVAIFPTGKYLFGEEEQSSRIFYYANRWNLVPSDVEAYRAGELVEPERPIVFYIDNNFPEQWKPHIKEGVEQWNELFEKIGFKNAIKAVDFPLDDPEFDPDNIKYSCVRYAPIGIQNAMGPSWVDPRSGEIINASVYIFHDIIKLLNNWLFVQISPANPAIRSMNIPDDIMNDGLRYVVAHEVGHCLGFMHNMSSSSVIPIDSLRSPTFTNTTGTTTSIMDYARFNYVAQPGDYERGVKLTPPRFGAYDLFTIKWNYKYFPDVKDAAEEAEVLSAMVSEAIKDPVYRYGKQLSFALDPRSQTEDLGDDPIKASVYGIKNLKFLISNLNSWVGDEDEDFSYRSEIYEGIVFQYIRYINHIFANVGGIYLNEVKVKDNMVPFQSVEREKQRESLLFIMNQIKDLDWLDNKELSKNLTIMGSAKELIQAVLARAIISAPAKVMLSSSISEDPYDFFECSQDLYNFIWGPTMAGKRLTPVERMMQTQYINGILQSSNIAKLVKGIGIEENSRNTLFEILSQEDISGRFSRSLERLYALEAGGSSPVAGYGVPSTKFSVVFNIESNYFIYLSQAKRLLERRVKSGSGKEDRLHYQLLLKSINSSLRVQ